MWKNDAHACAKILEFLQPAGLAHYWTSDGPTPEACALLDAGIGALSHGEQIVLRVAFDLWNGSGKATVDDLVTVLDQKNLNAALTAILEVRPDATTPD